jgi:hypothetical protein
VHAPSTPTAAEPGASVSLSTGLRRCAGQLWDAEVLKLQHIVDAFGKRSAAAQVRGPALQAG